MFLSVTQSACRTNSVVFRIGCFTRGDIFEASEKADDRLHKSNNALCRLRWWIGTMCTKIVVRAVSEWWITSPPSKIRVRADGWASGRRRRRNQQERDTGLSTIRRMVTGDRKNFLRSLFDFNLRDVPCRGENLNIKYHYRLGGFNV